MRQAGRDLLVWAPADLTKSPRNPRAGAIWQLSAVSASLTYVFGEGSFTYAGTARIQGFVGGSHPEPVGSSAGRGEKQQANRTNKQKILICIICRVE